MDNNMMVSSGASFCALITIAFVVLKLCGVISWSWVLVFLPLIIDVGVAVLIILVVTIVALIRYGKKKRKPRL